MIAPIRPPAPPLRGYQRLILAAMPPAENLPDLVDVELVEAWMRLEHGTLDGLSPAAFRMAVAVAVTNALATSPEDNRALAASYFGSR